LRRDPKPICFAGLLVPLRLIAQGLADLVAFGRPFIANPNLVTRLKTGAPLAEIDWTTVYGSGPQGYSDYGYSDYPALQSAPAWSTSSNIEETVMSKTTSTTTSAQNKALVLESFNTLFNKRDYITAERFWSDRYIQHSAHIAPGRDGLFNLVRTLPATLKYENQSIVAEGDYDRARALLRPWPACCLGRCRHRPHRGRQTRRASLNSPNKPPSHTPASVASITPARRIEDWLQDARARVRSG
jgi:hypothetical protein